MRPPSGPERPRLTRGDVVSLVTLSRLANGGDAVARGPDGRVVFVRGAAPDERVDVRLTEVKKRFLRAEVVRVVQPGPARADPACAAFGVCGGCRLMHLAPAHQTEQGVLAGLDTLARVGGLAWPRERLGVWRGDPLGARTRARFAVKRGRVGFRALRSHEIAPVATCLALHPKLEAARVALAAALLEHAPEAEAEVEAVTDGARVLVRLPPALAALAPALAAAGVDEVEAAGPLRARDGAGALRLRPDVFAQASLQGNDALLERVAARLPEAGELAVELYAGSGNLTRLLAARFRAVEAVELDGPAVALGEQLGLRGVAWRRASALEGWRALAGRAPELLLVDPPRSGLEPGLAAAVVERPPPRLVYVSCDVGTLARDLRALREGGLRIEALDALDLYPQTPHLEWCVALAI